MAKAIYSQMTSQLSVEHVPGGPEPALPPPVPPVVSTRFLLPDTVRISRGFVFLKRALCPGEELLQLSAVQPRSVALLTGVDRDTVSSALNEISGFTSGTVHGSLLLTWQCVSVRATVVLWCRLVLPPLWGPPFSCCACHSGRQQRKVQPILLSVNRVIRGHLFAGIGHFIDFKTHSRRAHRPLLTCEGLHIDRGIGFVDDFQSQ